MITLNVSGNIIADAIVRNVNGTDVVNFSVASNNRYKTPSGEIKEDVTFINCQLWNKKEVAEHLFKGRSISVTGFFKTRSFVGNDGVMRMTFSVRVTSFQMFGKNKMKASEPQAEQIQEAEITQEEPTANIDDLPF